MRFEELLTEYNIAVAPTEHEHSREGWVQFDCPFCPVKNHYRMGYNLQGQYINCWVCGPHSMEEVLVHAADITWGEAKRVCSDLDRGPAVERVVHEGTLKLPNHLGELGRPHRAYLRSRGFNPDTLIRLWHLKATSQLNAKLPWRIVVPITHHGEVVSWTSRKLKNEGMRWRSASTNEEAMSHKKILYGYDYVRHACVVSEGPSDTWAIGPGGTATCGTGYSQAQVLAIARVPLRIICFDSSTDAQDRARELCDSLEAFDGRTLRVELDAEDPGSAPKREITALRRLLGG